MMMNLRKTWMKIRSPLFLERSTRCGETKEAPSGKTPREEYPKKAT